MRSTRLSFPFALAALLALVAGAGATFAASTTGPIAVLDFELKNAKGESISIQTLDCPDHPELECAEVPGTLRVFENHTTPLLSDGSEALDIKSIRTGAPSLVASIDLKRRGASSAYHPKKGYALDFKSPVSLLGMPVEQEWVLHSCWADKTCLRNVIGYWQAIKLFPWAPRTEFAEVFINGEYRGLYVVVEKVKVSPSRVNLPPPNNNAWNGGINGTYILKRDAWCDKNQDPKCDYDWTTFYGGEQWWLVFPKKKDGLTEAQLDYIKSYMDVDFGATFYPGSPGYEPWEYDEVMDEQSAADFVIIQEIANNVDAYAKSLHVTKYPAYPHDDLVHMGPIWDLDLAFANYDDHNGYSVCETNQWRMERAGVFRPLAEMWKVGEFRRAIYDRWWALRNNARVSRRETERQIDDFAAHIADARVRDDRKWGTLNKQTWWECWNKPTYQEEVDVLKRWIRARITWMDEQLSDWRFLNP